LNNIIEQDPRQQWLRQAVERRLREELAKLQVEVNEEKSRKVDLQRGESFGFLGFEFRRIRSRQGRWMPLLLPKGKKRRPCSASSKRSSGPLVPSRLAE
jgi:RNA-directed DNA polymerase